MQLEAQPHAVPGAGSAAPYDEKLKQPQQPMLTVPPQTSLGAPAPVPVEDGEGDDFPRATVKSDLTPVKPQTVPMPTDRDVFADPEDDVPNPPKVAKTVTSPTSEAADIPSQPVTEKPTTKPQTVASDTDDAEPVVTKQPQPTAVSQDDEPSKSNQQPAKATAKQPAPIRVDSDDEDAVPMPPVKTPAKPSVKDATPDVSKAPLLPDLDPEPAVPTPSTEPAKTVDTKVVDTKPADTKVADPKPVEDKVPEFKPIDINAEPFTPAKISDSGTEPPSKPEVKTPAKVETKTEPKQSAPQAETKLDKPESKPVEKPMLVEQKQGTEKSDLPQITPGPVTAKTELPKPVEPTKPVPQVSATVKAPVEPKFEPTTPAPSELPLSKDPLPVGGRVLLRDIAEFETPVESITASDDGTIFVSHRTGISRLSQSGQAEVWARMVAPRGHAILEDGMHIVGDANQRAILKLNQQGYVIEKMAVKSDGYFLRAPTDVVVDAEGGVYFSDPGYARIRNPIGQVHYISATGKVNLVAQKLAFPEGLSLSPDGKRLYVVESQKNQVLSFDVMSGGRVGPKKILATIKTEGDANAEGSIAGLSVDEGGRLYVAHRDANRIEVLDANGHALTTYSTGKMAVADVVMLKGSRPQLLIGGAVGADRSKGLVQVLDLPTR